ncbi:lysoplasmalogenase family protein [Flavobacterium terrigena]|uniref:YhhN-like protein n=1 Tax=Flavobacterium terrigena TaxID=402734 RepID=A0A1H6V2Z7_9FLAO|nr:lysoplasmalogenase family protein [Flavobacterium terrigena]SEI95000.1 YhhN-like protein [Flavobacterium terrigena]
MSKKTILYAFIVVCVLYFFSSLLQLDSLEVLTKPLFLPVLFLYYIKKSKGNFQNRVVVSFIFYYIAEMLVLKDNKEYYLISISFFLVPYLILLYFVVKDLLLLLRINSLNKINFSVIFVLAFLVYLYVSIILIIDTESAFEKLLLYSYGFVLLLLGIFAITIYVLKHSASNLFLVMTVIAFVVSDMFYIFIIKIEYNWVFKSVNLISQLLSYYFFVTFSLIKVKGK